MKHLAMVLLVGMGMVGVHFGVNYAGWVIAIGLIVIVLS